MTTKVNSRRIIRFKHPEPGTDFLCEEWKAARNNDKAIVDIVRHQTDTWMSPDRPWKPLVPSHTPYKITLQDTSREQGLQVIVEMDNIELTPQSPNYASNTWQLEGQLNEHIAALAVFAYGVANITKPQMTYCQYTSLAECFYQYHEQLNARFAHLTSLKCRSINIGSC